MISNRTICNILQTGVEGSNVIPASCVTHHKAIARADVLAMPRQCWPPQDTSILRRIQDTLAPPRPTEVLRAARSLSRGHIGQPPVPAPAPGSGLLSLWQCRVGQKWAGRTGWELVACLHEHPQTCPFLGLPGLRFSLPHSHMAVKSQKQCPHPFGTLPNS